MEPHSAPEMAHRPGLLASCASVWLGALAAGVVWCFASIWLRIDVDYLIVPLGVALGLFLRWQGFRGRWGAGCAAFATLIAFAYAQYLFAAVRIAQSLGLSLRDALFKSGPALTTSVAWGNLHTHEGLILLLATAASMATAGFSLRRTRPRL